MHPAQYGYRLLTPYVGTALMIAPYGLFWVELTMSLC
jgi:hypothetical protein